MGLLYLYVYAAVLIFIAIRSIKKKMSSMYCFLWIIYAVTAVFCVLNKTFQDTLIGRGYLHDEWYNLSDTSLWAYILLVVCYYIAFSPFKQYSTRKYVEEFDFNPVNKFLLKVLAYGFVVLFFVYVISSFSIVRGALTTSDYLSVRNSFYGAPGVESNTQMATNFIGNFCYKACWALRLLEIYVGFMLIYNGKKALGIVLLICDLLLIYIYSNVIAARGGLLIFLFCAFLFSLPVLRKLQKKTKRFIVIGSLSVGAIVFTFIANVTVARFSNYSNDGNLVLQNVCFYLGHSPIVFSKISGSITSFGFGRFIGGRLLNHYFGIPYEITSLKANIGYPTALNNLFATFAYPIYIDFGSIGCIVFFYIWAKLIEKLLKKKKVRLSTIFMFAYYLNFFVTGNFVISTLEFASMITTTTLYFLFRALEDTLYRRKNIR